MGRFSNLRQRQVLHLEPSRGGSAIAYFIFFGLMGVACAAVVAYGVDMWPASIERPDVEVSDGVLFAVGGVTAALSLTALALGFYNLSRWRLARAVLRASNSPLLGQALPSHQTAVAERIAVQPPPLEVRFVKPRKLDKPPKPLMRVTVNTNVIGLPPVNITYLRLFDNQPRARTFLESSWREFGYVHLLRAATSVTRGEFKRARRLPSLDQMFVHDDAALDAVLHSAPRAPLPAGRIVLPDVAPTRVKVRDRYGSYPIRAILCHGEYWQRAVDVLLGSAGLVVLDLSGFTDRNAGAAYELQRVIDLVPIERIIVLCDEGSSKKFVERSIREAWAQMNATSPNALPHPRLVIVGISDYYRRSQSQDGNQQTNRVRLVSHRRHSRRLATLAYRNATAA
jgi:hypothetical protein